MRTSIFLLSVAVMAASLEYTDVEVESVPPIFIFLYAISGLMGVLQDIREIFSGKR